MFNIIISYMYATPTGTSVVLINIIIFTLFWLIETIRKSNIINSRRENHA